MNTIFMKNRSWHNTIYFHILVVICFTLVLNLNNIIVKGLSDKEVKEVASPGNDDEGKNNDFIELAEDEYDLGYGLRLTVHSEPIESIESEYQNITLYSSPKKFGKVLVIDDCIQLTEWDAPNYNEMLAHVGMMGYTSDEVESSAKHVAVIGGGDGYIVNEILKHPSVTQLDHIELDPSVIKIAKQYFSWGKVIWDDDPRVTLHLSDGALFIQGKSKKSFYDVIIQDTSDPFIVEEDGSVVTLPSSVLYTYKHFLNVYGALSNDGVFVFQSETYNVPFSLGMIRTWRDEALKAGFVSVRYGTIGQIGFFLCTKKQPSNDMMNVVKQRFSLLTSPTKYYHPKLQISCFDLPLWVEKHIYDDTSTSCDTSLLSSGV